MEDKAKRILTNNLFMTLATVSPDGQPWSTPVFYALDKDFNFYWYSRKDTKHSLFLKDNPKVSISVFSTAGDDAMVGVYAEGKAIEVIDETDLEIGLSAYAAKAGKTEEDKVLLRKKEDFLHDALIRLYKLTPEKIYVSGKATKWNGKWIDTKEEVKL